MGKSKASAARDAARHTKGYVGARVTRRSQLAKGNARGRGRGAGGFSLSAAEPSRSRKRRRGRR